ncbi:hypothetical protein, partial [Corynebacterium diphtheriae]|uniref:hypothetical protein n=1 Tax=Corynebacterium diphtheriae TaxID=1717 RepID=UPI001A7E093F
NNLVELVSEGGIRAEIIHHQLLKRDAILCLRLILALPARNTSDNCDLPTRRTTRSFASLSNFFGMFQIFPSIQTEQNLGHFTMREIESSK